jgi:hypothetical protein
MIHRSRRTGGWDDTGRQGARWSSWAAIRG